MDTKQVIVVRKSLNMRKGKIAAQVAHASMAFLTRGVDILYDEEGAYIQESLSEETVEWLKYSFVKVVVYVDSEDELLEIERKAKEKGLVVHLITDSGRTEFKGVPTNTCLAIGPHEESKFEGVTNELPLL